MKLKNNSIFGIKLLIALAFLFLVHELILHLLNLPLLGNRILLSYGVNYLLAFSAFSVIYLVRKKYQNLLGFIFLGFSLFKFVIFFLFFYPFYRQDGIITKPELFSFLAPYFLCLIMETYSLAKLMNNND